MLNLPGKPISAHHRPSAVTKCRLVTRQDPILERENIEITNVSDLTIITLALGQIVWEALRTRRGIKLRVSPRNLELDLDQPDKHTPNELPPSDTEILAEAALEPARELRLTGL